MNPSTEPVPPLPRRDADANKGSVGKVLIVGGSRGMAGAPCLAARGALRGGAGLVRVAVPEAIWDVVAVKLDECLTDGLPSAAGAFAGTALDSLRVIGAWADVVVLGPGLGQSAETVAVIRGLLRTLAKPIVLDADGLNAFRGEDVRLLRESQQSHSARPLVLTPHPGEAARLSGTTAQDVQAAREDAVRQLCDATGATVLLKGAGTLVCNGARLYTNRTGNPGMATGGTGDVLSGLIGALLGQGMSAFDAACLGAHLHGLAGDLAARTLGVWSLTAGDLVTHLPAAFLAQDAGEQTN